MLPTFDFNFLATMVTTTSITKREKTMEATMVMMMTVEKATMIKAKIATAMTMLMKGTTKRPPSRMMSMPPTWMMTIMVATMATEETMTKEMAMTAGMVEATDTTEMAT
jgi:hypothetical protein